MGKKELYVDLLIITVLTITVIAFAVLFQKHIESYNGKGHDGSFYYQMARHMSEYHRPFTSKPFIYNVAIPFISAMFFRIGITDNLLSAFKFVNVLASIISIFLLYIWLNLWEIKRFWKLLLVSLFIFSWLAPLRMSFCFPAHTDPGAWVFILGILILIKIDKPYMWLLISLASFAGAFVRMASIILLPLVYIIESTKTNGKYRIPSIKAFIPLISCLLGFFILQFLIFKAEGFSLFNTSIHWIFVKPLSKVAFTPFYAFGPIIFLLFLDSETVKSFMKENIALSFYLLTIVFLSYIGGSAGTRLIYFALPVVAVILGLILSGNKIKLDTPIIIFLLFSQSLSMRVFAPIPVAKSSEEEVVNNPEIKTAPRFSLEPPRQADKPLILSPLTPLSSKACFLDMYADHASKKIFFQNMLFYLLIGSILILYIKFKNEKKTDC
ncbi:MAG: hypothetical protein JXA60_04095 [Candidatus Coatesbacteria bacterium]|nr:hypothetical protein [Candidatus Coatesbacteria bacterium]